LNNVTVLSLATSGSNIFAGTSNGVYLSTNNGANWTQINDGFNPVPTVYSLAIANNYIFAGTYGYSVWKRSLSITEVKNISPEMPSDFALHQNYPNPFNPVTNIKFDIPKSEFVTVKIFDVTGREIETLLSEQLQAGRYSISWDATNYPSGVYFYQLITNSYSQTKKMILIK
jgi:hypothetical protein